jgi:hypothetical protein
MKFCIFSALLSLVGALMVMATAPSAMAGTGTYRLGQVAASIDACNELKASLVKKFPQSSRSQVLSDVCERNYGGTFDVVIEYTGLAASLLVSTYNEGADVHGLFATAEECEASRMDRISQFSHATGLDPFVAYCFRDRQREQLDKLFTLRIDAFGKPKLKPYSFARHIYTSSNVNPEADESGFENALMALGASAVDVKIYKDTSNTSVMAQYYASRRLPLLEHSDGFVTTLADCERYRDVMREIYARAGGQSAIYFCAIGTEAAKSRIYSVGLVSQPLASELATVKYQTQAACEAQRAATEETWRLRLGRDVVGSVCALEWLASPTEVSMRLFWVE